MKLCSRKTPCHLTERPSFRVRLDPGGGMSIYTAGLHEALWRSRIHQISVTGTSSTLALPAKPTMAPRSIVLQALLLTACLLGRLRAGGCMQLLMFLQGGILLLKGLPSSQNALRTA